MSEAEKVETKVETPKVSWWHKVVQKVGEAIGEAKFGK